jgi:hypothetical protein
LRQLGCRDLAVAILVELLEALFEGLDSGGILRESAKRHRHRAGGKCRDYEKIVQKSAALTFLVDLAFARQNSSSGTAFIVAENRPFRRRIISINVWPDSMAAGY